MTGASLVKQLNETVNINNFPELDQNNSVKDGVHLTMGDLHGNGLKLLYMLIRHGVLKNISKEDYEFFSKEVYPSYVDPDWAKENMGDYFKMKKSDKKLTKENMKRFETMVKNAHVNSQPGFVIKLIGDELGDRGFNDYYVLKILEKLGENKVMFDIAISNHSIDSINAYENGNLITDNPPLRIDQAGSIVELGKLILSTDFPDINEEKINEIFAKAYMPNLKMFSYSLSKDGTEITFQSHAPVNLDPIKEIAAKFNIAYKEGSAKELAQTLDQLNEHFQSEYVKKNKIHELFPGNKNVDKNSPFYKVTWSREHGKRPDRLANGDKINFVHGHDSKVQSKNNIYNTDNILGKNLRCHEGAYNIVVAQSQLMPNVKLENENVAPLAQKTTKNTKVESKPTNTTSPDPTSLLTNFVKNLNMPTSGYLYQQGVKEGWGGTDGWDIGIDKSGNRCMQNLFFKIQQNSDGSVIILDKTSAYTPVSLEQIQEVKDINKGISIIRLIIFLTEKEFIKKSKPLIFSATSAPQPFSIASVDPVKQFLGSVKNKEKLTKKGAFKVLNARYVKETFNFVGENPEFGFAVGVSKFNNSFYIQDPNISVQLLLTGEVNYVNRKNGNKLATSNEVAQSSLVQNIHKAITQSPLEEKKNVTTNPKLSM